ncbi:MAG: NERD domain-containing protein, partial [Proteobacteria bacterium]|nr:NERD domain-containing protein [Pseudomonadota bacterium]
LGVLLGAIAVAVIAGGLCLLLLAHWQRPEVADWVWAVVLLLAVAAAGVAGYFVFRLVQERRRFAFTWAGKAAVGNILKRLNLAGNSVFHCVVTESARIDHVVVGRKGVFALNVVARPVPKRTDGTAGAELKNGKLWLAGSVEALPVGEAARNMTVLSGALSKLAGHRVPVRSVLVVPGWHTLPTGGGNHLVLSEKNLAMLTSWNTPDAYLMDEDCVAIHAFLHQASRVSRLD